MGFERQLERWIGPAMLLVGCISGQCEEGAVRINPQGQGPLITDWGYDIKQANRVNLSERAAKDIFGADRMSVLRVAVWGEPARPAHPGPGEIDLTYYTGDGGGGLNMVRAMKHARKARPDVLFFASKKMEIDRPSMPAWTMAGGGMEPRAYARMLADYLRFWEHDLVRKDDSFVFTLLGINNEGCAFPKKASHKHVEVYEELLELSRQSGTVDLVDRTHTKQQVVTVPAAFTLPMIIGVECYNPEPDVANMILDASGGDESVQVIGTHYYPEHRVFGDLEALAEAADKRPVWHSEVHWQGKGGTGPLDQSARSLAAIFDCTDIGFTGFSWWSYGDRGSEGLLRQAITRTTAEARRVEADDPDGTEHPEAVDSLITRAFLQGGRLHVWTLNATHDMWNPLAFRLEDGGFGSAVEMTQWVEAGNGFDVKRETVKVSESDAFSVSLPRRSIALLSVPYVPEKVRMMRARAIAMEKKLKGHPRLSYLADYVPLIRGALEQMYDRMPNLPEEYFDPALYLAVITYQLGEDPKSDPAWKMDPMRIMESANGAPARSLARGHRTYYLTTHQERTAYRTKVGKKMDRKTSIEGGITWIVGCGLAQRPMEESETLKQYTVKKGDTYWSIRTALNAHALEKSNPGLSALNPPKPGTVLSYRNSVRFRPEFSFRSIEDAVEASHPDGSKYARRILHIQRILKSL